MPGGAPGPTLAGSLSLGVGLSILFGGARWGRSRWRRRRRPQRRRPQRRRPQRRRPHAPNVECLRRPLVCHTGTSKGKLSSACFNCRRRERRPPGPGTSCRAQRPGNCRHLLVACRWLLLLGPSSPVAGPARFAWLALTDSKLIIALLAGRSAADFPEAAGAGAAPDPPGAGAPAVACPQRPPVPGSAPPPGAHDGAGGKAGGKPPSPVRHAPRGARRLAPQRRAKRSTLGA